MRTAIHNGLAVALILASSLAARGDEPRGKETSKGMIGHMVFFTLNDNTPEARQKLVDACKKYLDKHEGTVYFSAGARSEDFTREVNDKDFDVALHLVFKDKAAHDKYQDHPRHLQFIEENKASWKKVRVFDSVIK